jgi:hypothetical protein
LETTVHFGALADVFGGDTPQPMNITSLNRRSFLGHLALLGGAVATSALLPACAAEGEIDEDGTTGEDELRACTSLGATVGTNHGHALTVSPADVTAGTAKTYTLSGLHAHKVLVTSADFAKLRATGTIVIASSTDLGHAHAVTVTCTGAVVAPPPPAGGTCSKGTSAAQISANHAHALTIPAADITRGAAKTYSIRGASGHDHTVTVSAADFAKLKAAGGSLTLTSSAGAGHSHTVSVRCA